MQTSPFMPLIGPETHRVLNPNLAGGSLLDIGIYPIFLVLFIVGETGYHRIIFQFLQNGGRVSDVHDIYVCQRPSIALQRIDLEYPGRGRDFR